MKVWTFESLANRNLLPFSRPRLRDLSVRSEPPICWTRPEGPDSLKQHWRFGLVLEYSRASRFIARLCGVSYCFIIAHMSPISFHVAFASAVP